MGKSTIINKILTGYPGCVCGFRTLPYYEQGQLNGFYLQPMIKELCSEQLFFIGRCLENNRWEVFPEVFVTLGVDALDQCLKQKPDLIVMDELGFFERDAFKFHRKVFEVLDSTIPVLGVIKQADIAFLNTIRERRDVEVITVTEENRDDLHKAIVGRGDFPCLFGQRKI